MPFETKTVETKTDASTPKAPFDQVRRVLRPTTRRFWRAIFANLVPAENPTDGLQTITFEDLEPGDWVFCERPGCVSLVNRIAGHYWRHVTIVIRRDDELVLADLGPWGFGIRTLAEASPSYTTMAVLRLPLPDDCRDRISRAVLSATGGPNRYSRRALALGALWMVARRIGWGAWPPLARSLERFAERNPRAVGALCSTFVVTLTRCCIKASVMPRGYELSVNPAVVDVVATPTDMWRSGLGRRFALAPANAAEYASDSRVDRSAA